MIRCKILNFKNFNFILMVKKFSFLNFNITNENFKILNPSPYG
jgi:hypothetical protein